MEDVKQVLRDGKYIYKFKCHSCGNWGEIDNDQYNGKVSILCICGFHETINLNKKQEK